MKVKKQLKTDQKHSLPEEEFDGFIIALIDKLKSTGDPIAVAEVKDFYISPEFNELLSFVGITAKQVDNIALFAWTESVVNPKPKGDSNGIKK